MDSGEPDQPTLDLTRHNPPGLAASLRLQPGYVLGDRFVVIQFLASGGMGDVYEVEDRRLQGKHFAIKVLRSDLARHAGMRQRFEREVLLSREVVHRNVCPTYDLFNVTGPHGPILFFSMKLLLGEPLGVRLKRSGPLDPATALLVARQIAAGLEAAHTAGVIHRDFKPGNVMLEGAGAAIHAVITDFGLSRLYDSDRTLGNPGEVSGTPGYIAPELQEGRPASPASDVYAFGLVLHEMITGVHRSRSARATAKGNGPQPELPDSWKRAVEGCLARDPADRFQSAQEVIAVLEGRPATPGSRRANGRKLTRREAIGAGAGAAVAVLAGSYYGWPALDSILNPLPERRFVALMAWPEAPDVSLRPLLSGILDVIANGLTRAEAFSKNLLVLRPQDISGDTVREPGEAVHKLGANLVMTASLQAIAGRLLLELRVLEATAGRILRHNRVIVPVAEANQLPERASVLAAHLLQLPPAQVRSSAPDELRTIRPAAYEAFAAAEERRREPNDMALDQAIASYQKALELEPDFALGYARLAMAYVRKYHKSKDTAVLRLAEKNADRALSLAPKASDALFSKGMMLLYSGRTAEALAHIEAAERTDPGNPEIMLYQAAAFGDLNKTKEEEQTYYRILKDRPNYWPAYNELGWLLYSQGKIAEAAARFQEAAAVAPQIALPLANAGSMYLLLNRKRDAAETFRKSLIAAPNELAYINLGNLEWDSHEYRKALGYYQQARGVNPKSHEAWRSIGDCEDVLGDRKRMVDAYREAADLMAEYVRANPQRALHWMTLAFYDAKSGRPEKASADIATGEGRGAANVQAQFLKAQTLAVLGRDEEALKLVLECLGRGLTAVEVDYALDLKHVRADARYRKRIAELRSKPVSPG